MFPFFYHFLCFTFTSSFPAVFLLGSGVKAPSRHLIQLLLWLPLFFSHHDWCWLMLCRFLLSFLHKAPTLISKDAHLTPKELFWGISPPLKTWPCVLCLHSAWAGLIKAPVIIPLITLLGLARRDS